MKTILVTGGAGFIGSHACLLLLEKGFEIYVLDSFVNSSSISLQRVLSILKERNLEVKEKLHIEEGDIRNEKDIEKIFIKSEASGKSIDAVIHFAGLKSVFESILEPINYWENNVAGTIKLLRILDKYNCKTIVFSSSATVYKSKKKELLNEKDLCEPVNPYGTTKLTIENILNDIYVSQLGKWKIACLRYFNPVGAHESGLIGENPLGKFNNIYPQLTKVAIGKQDKIKIFGSDWPTKDGTGVRDYIHVMDLAEGHLKALDYLDSVESEIITINIGTGKGYTVLELIKTFEKVANVKIPFTFEARRVGDNASVVADNSLAKKCFKWSPQRSLETICRDGWNWQVKNPNGFAK